MNLEGLSVREKRNLAKNPNTPPEILTRLADDEYWVNRSIVASNPNTPPKTLERLADDKWAVVRCWVAKNPNTPPETLARLVDKYPWYVKRNPNTPKYVIEYLNAVNFWRTCTQ